MTMATDSTASVSAAQSIENAPEVFGGKKTPPAVAAKPQPASSRLEASLYSLSCSLVLF